MGPKKPKSRSADEEVKPPWQSLIEQGVLDEETFRVKVFLIDAAENERDRVYLNKFESFANKEKRFVIKNISKTETVFMVNQLGAEKKVQDDNLLVFEEAERYLKERKEIPTELFATIIKQLIMSMKEEYLFVKKAKLEVKEGLRRESSIMLKNEEIRGTASIKRHESRPATTTKNASKVETEDSSRPVDGKKYNTNLRVRGEEWRDKTYIDDFPLDGPNLYVSVSGFLNPMLAGCLIKIGVPVTAVLKICIDPSVVKIPSALNPATKKGQSEMDFLWDKTITFWSDLQQIRLHKDTCDTYKNTAFIIFSPPYGNVHQLSLNPEQIYDEVCYLMYDVQDLTRQHTHYLNNMEMVYIPEFLDNTALQKRYQRKMADLPLECVTQFSLLNGILESICNDKNDHDDQESMSSESDIRISTEDIKVLKAKTLVRNIFNTLCKTDCHKTYRVTYGDEYENQKDPIIINYGDFAKYKTFHLEHVNSNEAVESSLNCMPILKLWNDKSLPNEELEAKVDFHYNVLVSCLDKEDMDSAGITRLLQILACRKVYNNRSSLKKDHLPGNTIDYFKKSYLKRTKLAEPITVIESFARSSSPIPSPTIVQSEIMISSASDSDSDTNRVKYLFECPDLSELISAGEISAQSAIQSDHIIDDYEYFEDFCGVSALQVVHEAFNNYNCVNYKYCEVTDSFILMFFNSHDNEGISRHEWRSHLLTPVCLHDFFDFVLEEEYKWIQKEEAIYDEDMMLRSHSLLKDSVEVIQKTCIENTDIGTELLMEGSLKYQDIQKDIESFSQSPKEPSISAVSEKTEKTFTTKGSAKKSPKNVKGQKAFLIKENETKDEPLDVMIQHSKPFVGFDICDRRVEVFGKDSTFFSKDGTKVTTSYIFLIPSFLEYISLNVVPGITKNEFWFHKALGEYASKDAVEVCDSFRINTKDQINIIIKKQEFTVPVVVEFQEPETPTPRSKVTSQPTKDTPEKLYETRSFYSFLQTWPNGLITESVYVDNSDQISHIKQYQTQKISDLEEEKRCISLNGEVVIFKMNHEIEVLKPDGTHILVNKVSKKKIKTENDFTILSQSSKFTSKSRAKSSKKLVVENEKDDPSAQYEFFIEEFEIIETDGKRQKWINDTAFHIEKLIIRTATDYCIGEVFTRRMDGTNTLLNKDGLLVVTFPNNTRIITAFIIEDQFIYPEWTDEEIDYFQLYDVEVVKVESTGGSSVGTRKSTVSFNCEEETISENDKFGYVSVQLIYTIEHDNFARITVNKSEAKITVDSINHVSLTVNMENQYNICLDNATTAIFDGNNLDITYEACTDCGSLTTFKVCIANQEIGSEKGSDETSRRWLELKDSYEKKIFVTEEGTIFVDEDESSQEILQEGSITGKNEQEAKRDGSESFTASHTKCRNVYHPKSMRFMVLRRDLTCSELVHSALVEEYKHRCRWQPWCSINEHDTFGDGRKFHSIVLPINLTETEKWLLNSKLANNPKYLTFKDLKKDDGKGFYHWMRPYARYTPQPKKPVNVLPPRQPRAFVLRNLEKQWDEANKNECCGAKMMINAILRYRRVLEAESDMLLTVPSREFRSEEEQTVDKILYELNNRIVEDLRKRLSDDLSESVHPCITTKPRPSQEPEFLEEGLEEESVKVVGGHILEEERSYLKELNEAEEVSPVLDRYWKQRAEEYEEEQLYRHLLREGSVPPYFQNMLGGAIWWLSNNIATMAVMNSERQKKKCVCSAEEEASTRPTKHIGKTSHLNNK